MSKTIGEVLSAIKSAPSDLPVMFDFGRVSPTTVHSWRGIYAEAAIGFSSGGYGEPQVTVSAFRKELQKAIKNEFSGWKGGTYSYSLDTPLHVDNPGCWTCTEIVKIVVDDYKVVIHTERDEGCA